MHRKTHHKILIIATSSLLISCFDKPNQKVDTTEKLGLSKNTVGVDIEQKSIIADTKLSSILHDLEAISFDSSKKIKYARRLIISYTNVNLLEKHYFFESQKKPALRAVTEDIWVDELFKLNENDVLIKINMTDASNCKLNIDSRFYQLNLNSKNISKVNTSLRKSR